MSRLYAKHKTEEHKEIVYGYDMFPPSYFYQKIDHKEGDRDEEYITEFAGYVNPISNGTMLDAIQDYDIPESDIQKIAMDLPI